VLLLVAGCQAPAARFTTATAGATVLPCTVVFARQIVEDSALELTYHPWRCGQTVVAEPAKCLWLLGRGAIGKRLLMPWAGTPAPLTRQQSPLDPAELEQELDELLGARSQPAYVRVYPDGSDALAELKRLLNGAQRQIDVLMFQWENDAMGAEIADCLAAKANARLRVRVLVDGGGNLIFGHPTRSHPADVNGVVALLSEKPYVEVIRTRNPFGRVDHRKLVLVDGRVAWTGGRNFTHQSFFDQRDISVTVEGPLVPQLASDFEDFWREQGGKPGNETEGDYQAAPGGEVAPDRMSETHEANAQARLLSTGPMNHQIEQAMYYVVDRARHHVYMENYTFCDGLLVYKLAQARKRGVDVRVVLTFSDCTGALNRANRAITNRLLAAGVRVFVCPGMTHTKAAAVDGCWAYLGTGNFDPLSLRRNLELGVAVSTCPLVHAVEQQLFEADFRPEWELTKPLPLTWRDHACEVLASFCL
jgi:cardiolipin synthase A/B